MPILLKNADVVDTWNWFSPMEPGMITRAVDRRSDPGLREIYSPFSIHYIDGVNLTLTLNATVA